jgi:uncharacterized protein (TIGR02118 family)
MTSPFLPRFPDCLTYYIKAGQPTSDRVLQAHGGIDYDETRRDAALRRRDVLKIITLLNRKPGLTREEFSRYWAENHAPLAVRILPGVKRYVQNHLVQVPGGEEPPFDGAAEVWFETSWDKLFAWYQSEAGQALRDDEQKFIDTSRWITLFVEEKVIKE